MASQLSLNSLPGTCSSSNGVEPCFPTTPASVSWLCPHAAGSSAASAPAEIGRLDQEPCRLCSSIPTRIGSSCLSRPHVGFGVLIPLYHWSGNTALRPVGPRPKVFLVKEKQTHVTQWGGRGVLALPMHLPSALPCSYGLPFSEPRLLSLGGWGGCSGGAEDTSIAGQLRSTAVHPT